MEKNWSAKQMPRQGGKLAIVTGANRGLGYYTSLELARAGAEVIMAARDGKTAADARAQILAEVPAAKLKVEHLDLASLGSVREFANRVAGAHNRLDLLVNNAAVMSLPTRQVTVDNYERQFATNHLGHFALTGLLLPLLCSAPAPRVVTVASGLAAFGRLDFDNLQSEKRYVPQGAYEVSKLANLLFMLELNRRAPPGLLSVGAHPGVASTDLPQSGLVWLHKVASQHPSTGALSQLYAAAGDDVAGGDYFGPRGLLEMYGPPKKTKVTKRALDESNARELWKRSEALTGVSFALEAKPDPAPALGSPSHRIVVAS